MVSQYLYVSTAPDLSRQDIDDILASSAQYNASHGVTGLLLYNGRNFLQLLEGEESELVSLMLRINRDPRHSGISVIDHRTLQERACPDWSMQRIVIAESVERRREQLEAALPKGLDDQTRTIIMNFAVLN
jgi:hypothetical protein